MFEVFFLAALGIAAAGSLVAGLWDLKTTDIPDEVTVLMMVLGPVLWFFHGSISGDWAFLASSIVLGSVVFALGWLLYLAGKWGGGDAALLAGIVFLLPDPVLLLAYLMNLLVVSLAYTVVYAIGLGVRHPRVFGLTLDEMKARSALLPLLILAAIGLPVAALLPIGLLYVWMLAVFLALFAVYARQIERGVFKRAISVAALQPGMVLAASKKWVGVSAEEVARIRKARGKVEVKEGVRFGLVFFLSLAVTVLFGNVFLWLL